MRRQTVLHVLLPILLVLLSAASLRLVGAFMSGLESYQSPYAAGGRPGPQPTLGAPPLTRLTERVVLVVVDGLRDDTSRRMGFLDSLRRDGAWTVTRVGQPSFSKPGYAVLASGAWQEVNGVTLNGHRGRLAVDTLPARVRAAGLTTAVIGDEWWGELLGSEIDFPYLYPDPASYDRKTDGKAFADALSSLAGDGADFTLVHFTWTDTEAHASGGAGSERYLAAARRIDDYIRGIAKNLDPTRDTLVVTSDHGHLWQNHRGGSGHGGGEDEVLSVPLLMYGKGIRAGRLQPARAVDIAPTIAALLGVPAPLETQGSILWDALWASNGARAAGEIALARQAARFAPGYVRGLAGRVTGGIAAEISRTREVVETAAARYASEDYGAAERMAHESRGRLVRRLDEARTRALWLGRLKRLPLGLGAVLLTVLLLATGGSRRIGPAVAGGIIFVSADFLLYRYAFSDPMSLGVFPDTALMTFGRLFAVPAYLAASAVLFLFWLGRRRSAGGTPALDAAYLVFGFYVPLTWIALGGLVWNGFRVTNLMPDFQVGFITLATLLQIGFLGPLAIALPVYMAFSGRRPKRGVDVHE